MAMATSQPSHEIDVNGRTVHEVIPVHTPSIMVDKP